MQLKYIALASTASALVAPAARQAPAAVRGAQLGETMAVEMSPEGEAAIDDQIDASGRGHCAGMCGSGMRLAGHVTEPRGAGMRLAGVPHAGSGYTGPPHAGSGMRLAS